MSANLHRLGLLALVILQSGVSVHVNVSARGKDAPRTEERRMMPTAEGKEGRGVLAD